MSIEKFGANGKSSFVDFSYLFPECKNGAHFFIRSNIETETEPKKVFCLCGESYYIDRPDAQGETAVSGGIGA